MSHSVIGTGGIGFTAVGLELLQSQVLEQLDLPGGDQVSIEVPPYVVVGAEVFSAFEERNQLHADAFAGLSDRQIARVFQQGELPSGFRDELRGVFDSLEGPLIVRPSSTLEASLTRSFGGVYIAKLIPNVEDDPEKRLRHLAEAVKLVWASTYFSDAVSSRLGAGQSVDSEQMALVIQQLIGVRHGDRFYPTISAVARSYNHYPAPGNEPGEGVVSLALGLGKVIAGGHAWSYSPDRPTAPPPFKGMGDLLKYTQTSFFAVDLSGSGAPTPNREDEFLVRLGLADAEQDGTSSCWPRPTMHSRTDSGRASTATAHGRSPLPRCCAHRPFRSPRRSTRWSNAHAR
jgi:hypothetical protein